MEIYPTRQLAFFLASFAVGVLSCLLLWLLAAFRAFLGAYSPRADMRALYARSLPLLGYPVRFSRRVARGVWRGILTLCCDVFFCLALALCAILLFYEYNDGIIRPFALVLLFAGFVLARMSTARIGDRAIAYLAFSLAVVRTYFVALLLLPCRGVIWLVKRLILRPLARGWRAICRIGYRKRSSALCRAQLSLATVGLDPRRARKEGKKREKQKEKAPRR